MTGTLSKAKEHQGGRENSITEDLMELSALLYENNSGT